MNEKTMTENHPITPPPELVREWAKGCSPYDVPADHIATQAARWGADQELEACIRYFHEYDSSWGESSELISGLRAARRPNEHPPTADELIKLAESMRGIAVHEGRWLDELERVAQLLEQQSRALGALPND